VGHPRANFCFSVTFPFHPYTDGRKGGEVRWADTVHTFCMLVLVQQAAALTSIAGVAASVAAWQVAACQLESPQACRPYCAMLGSGLQIHTQIQVHFGQCTQRALTNNGVCGVLAGDHCSGVRTGPKRAHVLPTNGCI
jgi:hypothetical protein